MKKRSHHLIALIFPLLFILIGLYLLNILPVKNIVSPASARNIQTVHELYNAGENHIEITLPRLYTTGISYSQENGDKGVIYYALEDDTCMFFVLNAEKNMKDMYESATFRATVFEDKGLTKELISELVEELNWSDTALDHMTSSIIAQEAEYNSYGFLLFVIIFSIGSLISIYHIIKNIYKFLTISQKR